MWLHHHRHGNPFQTPPAFHHHPTTSPPLFPSHPLLHCYTGDLFPGLMKLLPQFMVFVRTCVRVVRRLYLKGTTQASGRYPESVQQSFQVEYQRKETAVARHRLSQESTCDCLGIIIKKQNPVKCHFKTLRLKGEIVVKTSRTSALCRPQMKSSTSLKKELRLFPFLVFVVN